MVGSASNRNEYQESSWGKGRPACKADDLTAICEPTVYRKFWILNVSQSYGPPWPVTGIALPSFTCKGPLRDLLLNSSNYAHMNVHALPNDTSTTASFKNVNCSSRF
jgi:hypothetical protein